MPDRDSRRGPSAARDPARPLVWFHAASVGEGLQAESVLLDLLRLHPETPVRLHPLQPLGRGRWRDGFRSTRRTTSPTTSRLRWSTCSSRSPRACSSSPSWISGPSSRPAPHPAGVTVAIVAATVSPGSGRLRWPVRALLRQGYRAVTLAAAVSDEDAGRLTRLGRRIRSHSGPRRPALRQRGATDLGSRPGGATAPLRPWRTHDGRGLHLAGRRGGAAGSLFPGARPPPATRASSSCPTSPPRRT